MVLRIFLGGSVCFLGYFWFLFGFFGRFGYLFLVVLFLLIKKKNGLLFVFLLIKKKTWLDC